MVNTMPSRTDEEDGAWTGDLPRGFFKMEVIKGRPDPSVHDRKLPDIEELRRKILAEGD